AALTILRAHALAGRPRQNAAALGSFESWDQVVRRAVWWATGFDPCGSRGDLQTEDRGTADLLELLAGWAELPGGNQSPGLSAKDALSLLNRNQDKLDRLRACLCGLARRKGEPPSARELGYILRKYRGRVV